jgi:hypothetical protein
VSTLSPLAPRRARHRRASFAIIAGGLVVLSTDVAWSHVFVVWRCAPLAPSSERLLASCLPRSPHIGGCRGRVVVAGTILAGGLQEQLAQSRKQTRRELEKLKQNPSKRGR